MASILGLSRLVQARAFAPLLPSLMSSDMEALCGQPVLLVEKFVNLSRGEPEHGVDTDREGEYGQHQLKGGFNRRSGPCSGPQPVTGIGPTTVWREMQSNLRFPGFPAGVVLGKAQFMNLFRAGDAAGR